MLLEFYIYRSEQEIKDVHSEISSIKIRQLNEEIFSNFSTLPIVIVLAVNITIPGETSKLGVQWKFALATLQTVRMPLPVHGQ